jgi:5'-methylthioadenosine phosphorylase
MTSQSWPDGHAPIDVGIIGGSGLADLPGLTDVTEHPVETPFGPPAGRVRVGTLEGVRVGFLARHGEGHAVAPAEAPYQANVWALKRLGARTLIGVTAVGSLREELRPGDLALPDDLIDRTINRPRSFFGPGLVAHIGLAPAYCERTRATLLAHAPAAGRPVHDGGTLVVIEGPRFSTAAESRFHRQIGADLVGMTALPEAALAREAELPYVSLAVVTDYDVWHPTHGEVSVAAVLATMADAAEGARALLGAALPDIAALGRRPAHDALAGAIQTAPAAVDPQQAYRLALLVSRYLDSDDADRSPAS